MPANECFLDGVLGVGNGAEHAVGNRKEEWTVFLDRCRSQRLPIRKEAARYGSIEANAHVTHLPFNRRAARTRARTALVNQKTISDGSA